MPRINPVSRLIAAVLLVAVPAQATEWCVAGSDLLGPAFAEAMQDFARRTDSKLALDLRGTRPAIEAVAAGKADIGLLLLPVGEPPPGDTITTRVVGWFVTVVVVGDSNPIEQISFPQLRAVFSSAGSDAAMRPLAMSPQTGLAWEHFRRHVLKEGQGGTGPAFAADHAALAAEVRSDGAVLAVTGARILSEPGLRLLAVARREGETAFVPTPENLLAGNYPLRMPLWLAFRRTDAPRLLPLLKFLLGKESAEALAGGDFMPLPPGERARLAFEFEEMGR